VSRTALRDRSHQIHVYGVGDHHLRVAERARRFDDALVPEEEVCALDGEVRVHPVRLEPHRAGRLAAVAIRPEPATERSVGGTALEQIHHGVEVVDQVFPVSISC
jgi:hypothetical protein